MATLMTRSSALAEFVQYARTLSGDEKGEAQVFLDRMFQGFGHRGYREAGATLEDRIKKSTRRGVKFADLVWRPVVLIEMKKRGENLAKHYRQAFDYWVRLVPGRPRWVVLCNFDEFWVYDFETQMDTPRAKVALDELPTNYGPLSFLFVEPEPPVFEPDSRAVTKAAADQLAACFKSIVARGIEESLARRFTLQMLTALFSQHVGLLERYTVTRALDDCKRPRDSYDLLGRLFVEMNTPGKTKGGRFKGVDHFNGGLFAQPVQIELEPGEIALLRAVASENWAEVRPEIFGTLFERSLGETERRASGAFFTSPADIMKIVGPTIVEPWTEAIEGAPSQKKLRELHARMQRYRVLDPACGSGNFLYIAYRELKRLEARIWEKISELSRSRQAAQLAAQMEFGFVSASQFYGIDVNPFAVELAKVTIMFGRKLAIDQLQINEPALPLDNLDRNFRVMDAVVTPDGNRAPWTFTDRPFTFDTIIGNPPFLDARKITIEHGREYSKRLRAAYPEIPGRADYCVYWFRRAHDEVAAHGVEDSISGRVGLVGTNTIRQNYSREGGLDYIVASGGTITEAVTSQVWSGDAAVNVSIVNWVKGPYSGPRVLHEQLGDRRSSEWTRQEVDIITSALSSATDVAGAVPLPTVVRNKRCFEGQQPGHLGFRFGLDKYRELAKRDPDIADVVFQYMNGDSLLSGTYRERPEFIVDFGDQTLIDASLGHNAILNTIEDAVLSKWQENANREQSQSDSASGEHRRRLQTWWRLKRRRSQMLDAISALSRYIVCVRHTKRPVFEFLCSSIRPDSALTVFAFEDDYSFGILQSDVHWQWFLARCSSLKRDFRYTNETVFDAFPWPQSPSRNDVESVARQALALREVRRKALAAGKGGLRELYRTLDLPGKNPLKQAHQDLDRAVTRAYGFRARGDVLEQLLRLNREVASAAAPTEPGVPNSYPNAESIITNDCVEPYDVRGHRARRTTKLKK